MRDIDGTASPVAFFGAELRRARNESGMSQEQLGLRIGYSAALVGKVETGDRVPTEDLARRCDEALDARGLLDRIYDLARRWDRGYPSWFTGWIDRERRATSLCWWEPLLVPGLVQTADYARAILEVEPHASEDELQGIVQARMDRQAILDRPDPPSLWVIIDETVLFRRIGSAKIMYDQLSGMAVLASRPTITIQVVPSDIGAHVGLLGGFAIASGNDADTVYMESPDQGHTTELPSVAAKLTQTFNILRTEALSQAASRELVMKVAEERWT